MNQEQNKPVRAAEPAEDAPISIAHVDKALKEFVAAQERQKVARDELNKADQQAAEAEKRYQRVNAAYTKSLRE